jgi:hypothetical protein
MKRTDLKRLMKPLIKECIHEILVNEGILAKVVTEVANGMNVATVGQHVVSEQLHVEPAPQENYNQESIDNQKQKLDQHRQHLAESVGNPALSHVFEGLNPMDSPADPGPNPMQGVSSTDAGVDISGLVQLGGRHWKTLASGKSK